MKFRVLIAVTVDGREYSSTVERVTGSPNEESRGLSYSEVQVITNTSKAVLESVLISMEKNEEISTN